MKKKSYISSIILVVATFVVLAFVSQYLHFRLDFTEGGQYSLSKATKSILKKLDSPVTITAYFTKDLAPNLAKTREDLRDMLIEYNNISGGNVMYKFENPNADEDKEKEAIQDGIRPVLFNAREKDEVKQQKVYMGLIIRLNEKKEVIPFIDPKASLEYELSTAIKKLSIKSKPKVGFVSGHGEPPLTSYPQLTKQLNILYDVQEVKLDDATFKPADYKVLVLAANSDTIPQNHFDILDSYLDNGGNIVVATNHLKGDLRSLTGTVLMSGVENWLQTKGINIKNSFITDAQCGSIQVRQQTSFGTMNSSMKFPYFPLASNFADNAATKGLEQIFFTFTAPLEYVGDSSRTFTPLIYSSEKSGEETAPVYFDVKKQWTLTDFDKSKQIIAGLLSDNNNNSKIIIIGNGDFANNGSAQRPQQKAEDNISLMANFIDLLSDDTGLVELRTKSITSRPIAQLEDMTKNIVKWLNFLIPILLVIIYGVIRIQINRSKRLKRMSERYVE